MALSGNCQWFHMDRAQTTTEGIVRDGAKRQAMARAFHVKHFISNKHGNKNYSFFAFIQLWLKLKY